MFQRKTPYKLFFLILFCLLNACSSQSVLVDGITSSYYEKNKSPQDTYFLLPLSEKNNNNLFFKELLQDIKNIFNENGFTVVDKFKNAKYVALIDFDTKSNTYTETKSIPITGQTGTSTSVSYFTGPTGLVTANTISTPQYGIVGYHSYQDTKTSYSHLLFVSAEILNHKKKSSEKAWEIIAVTTNSTSDFRRVKPVLLFTLKEFMGKNTKGQQRHKVDLD